MWLRDYSYLYKYLTQSRPEDAIFCLDVPWELVQEQRFKFKKTHLFINLAPYKAS